MLFFAFWFPFFLFGIGASEGAGSPFKEVVTEFTMKLTKGRHVILFGCNKKDQLETTKALLQSQLFVYPIKMPNFSLNFTLQEILTRHNHARTNVIVDCKCNGSIELLERSSEMRYFNKTYQWFLYDDHGIGVETLLPANLKYPGLNSQVTYANRSGEQYTFWDIHSKGRHLDSPLEFHIIATYNRLDGLTILQDINTVQGIKFRGQFSGVRLRGAAVIDQDNIITNEQIETVLSRPHKDAGVAAFVKYHYDLANVLKHRLNFTINFRNSRGWAGRLGNTTFRVGLLGVIQRNEADIAASGAFTRLNRFAEFDTIHQSWKFETGFLYRFTEDLHVNSRSGNFLSPFNGLVWIFSIILFCIMIFVWRIIERIKEMYRLKEPMSEHGTQINEVVPRMLDTNEKKALLDGSETSWSGLSLKTFAAICQQGMDPIPHELPSRAIVMTVFLFSLVMYNYYTSSVVGGLLSSTAQGPSTVDQVVSSPLKLSFEDIPYYRIMFRERINSSRTVRQLYNFKVLPDRSPNDLPVYTSVEKAIPYLKQGGYAFHCEVLDAYPEIARHFDTGEICDLRTVAGLMESDIFNWIITKQSQYSEIFRIVMYRASEVGIVKRLKIKHRPEKPPCQSLYRVFPITLPGVSSAFWLLAAGFVCGLLIMFIERSVYKFKKECTILK